MIKCPNCNNKFDEAENFWWTADEHGDPCVENLQCPKCHISTSPAFSCDICPVAFKCELDEECGPCASASYDDFKECDNDQTNQTDHVFLPPWC